MTLSRRIMRAFETRSSRRNANCPLLNLPSEVRLEIWKYVIGSLDIAIFREKGPDRERGRLTHGILDESKTQSPGHLFPVRGDFRTETIKQIYNRDLNPDHDEYLSDQPYLHYRKRISPMRLNPRKMPLSTLLKVCRLVYTETAGLLYSSHRFVFLQNSGLTDLHAMVPWAHFAQLSSLHVHWRLVEQPGKSDRVLPRDFTESAGAVLAELPRVRDLSIFFQGNMSLGQQYKALSEAILNIALHARPSVFMVRIPQPCRSHSGSNRPVENDPESAYFDPHLAFLDSNELFQTFKFPFDDSDLGPGESCCRFSDWSVWGQRGWVVGSWFAKPEREQHEESMSGVSIVNYALYIPDHTQRPKKAVYQERLRKINPLPPSIRHLQSLYRDTRDCLRKMGIMKRPDPYIPYDDIGYSD